MAESQGVRSLRALLLAGSEAPANVSVDSRQVIGPASPALAAKLAAKLAAGAWRVEVGVDVVDWNTTPMSYAQSLARLPIDHPAVVADFTKLATCATCSSPATYAGHCAYCADRLGMGAEPFTEAEAVSSSRAYCENNAAARARMDAADARDRPRSTATSRELAKPHPWSNADD